MEDRGVDSKGTLMSRPRLLAILLFVCISLVAAACVKKKPIGPIAAPPATLPVEAESTDHSSLEIGFENGDDDAIPDGFLAAETNGRGTAGVWRLEDAPTAPAGKKVVTLFAPMNVGESFNLLLAKDTYPADLSLSVRLKANGGVEDQGGGIVFRAKDERNYYVARWNPLEQGIVVFLTKDGVRTEIANVVFDADPKAWHQLTVSMKGGRGEAALDGRWKTTFNDAAIRDAGKIGIWTKADAASSFDDFRVTLGH